MGHMKCRVCATPLIDGNYLLTDISYGIFLCRICKSDKAKKYRDETNYNQLKNLDNKAKGFDILGNKCSCCGQDIWQFLTLDHINNDGALDRRNDKNISINSIYRFIGSEDLSRFQILCMNCNFSKGHNGFCSHIMDSMVHKLEQCVFCKTPLSQNNWFNLYKLYNYFICNECLIDKCVSLNTTIVDRKKKLRKKKDVLNVKYRVVNGYGGMCECCGERGLLFLTIDHVNGGGRKENKKLKKYGTDFYRWLSINNYPPDNYRLLCYNCNCCRNAYDICYHELCHNLNMDSISISEYKSIVVEIKKG